MIAFLLALLPLPPIPCVESLEINAVVQPVVAEAGDWWVIGRETTFRQVIARRVHPDTHGVEIASWSCYRGEIPQRIGGYWVMATSAGIVRSRVLFSSVTDYDPEAAERERLPSDKR